MTSTSHFRLFLADKADKFSKDQEALIDAEFSAAMGEIMEAVSGSPKQEELWGSTPSKQYALIVNMRTRKLRVQGFPNEDLTFVAKWFRNQGFHGPGLVYDAQRDSQTGHHEPSACLLFVFDF